MAENLPIVGSDAPFEAFQSRRTVINLRGFRQRNPRGTTVLIKNSYYRTARRAVLSIIEAANKTLFSLASAGVCLLSLHLLFAPTVLAQSPSVSVGSQSGLAGTAVDVPVNFAAGAIGVSALQFDLTLPSQLSYVSVTTGSAATAAGKSASGSTIPGRVRILIFGLNQTAIGSGQVAAVRLNISAGASGTLPVAISNIVASDPNGNPVSSGVSGGSVDTLPTITISATDPDASEMGPDAGTFTVSRTGSTSAALTVQYSVGGTASSGSDYSALAGSATIPSGSASAAITVTPVDDTSVESSETVIVTLSNNASYTVGSPNGAIVTIEDNNALPSVTISATDPNASEMGPDPGTFTISRTGSTSEALTVNYTVSGTASGGSDFSPLAGWVTIPAGSTSTTITVTPVQDTTAEITETVIVTLLSDASRTVGSSNSATLTIYDAGGTAPILVSLSTNRGGTGAPLLLSGTGFGSTQGSSRVTFNGMLSPITSWSATSIGVTVPEGSTSGPVVVSVNSTNSNGINFKVNGKLWPPGRPRTQ